MKSIYGLTQEEALELPVMVYLRYIITRSSGAWDSGRVQKVMAWRGWDTRATYPLNFAGNMLGRLEASGCMAKVSRGVYEAFPEIMHESQIRCMSRLRKKVSPSAYHKVLDWDRTQEPQPEPETEPESETEA